MEENNTNQNEQINNEKDKHICFKNHCWKKCLGMTLAAFLGGFLASYFAINQMMYTFYRPHHFVPQRVENDIFRDMDRMYKQDIKAFERAFKAQKTMKNFNNAFDMEMPDFSVNSVLLKTEFDDNQFNIIIDLRQFNNDESKIKYNVKGKKITVYGKSKVKDNDSEQDIEFSQDFILPKNADTSKITKQKEDNKYIISIPLK